MANTAINHDPAATFPGSSTNTAVVKWSGTSGNALLDSGVIIDASNNVTGLNNVTATGYLHLTGDEKELRFYEGANYIAIKTNASLAANYTLTLPLNDGAADEFLQTNGSGVLTWAAAAGTTINSNADNRVITGSGTANTLNGETGLVFTGTLLGINTATPDSGQYLHITGGSGSVSGLTATTTSQMTVENNSNAAISILSPAADFGAVYFGDPGSNIAGGLIYNHGATRFDFRVEGSTRMILDNNGNLGLGNTPAADAKLYVTQGSAGNWVLKLDNTGGSGGHGILMRWTAHTADDNSAVAFHYEDSTALRFRIYSDGDVQNHDNSYGSTSDGRLKENIVDARPALPELAKLRMREFSWISDGLDTADLCGVVAQEVLEAGGYYGGHFIKENGEGYYSAYYSQLVPMLVKAVQELKAEIDALGS